MTNSDTIPVRPEEAFDKSRLEAYLKGQLDGSKNSLAVRQFGGGKANLTYLLDYGEREYVFADLPWAGGTNSPDMAREYKVLSVLHENFPYAPQALLFCDDQEIIGAPFFIMDRKVGVVIRTALPDNFEKMANGPELISAQLINVLAEFHQVDYFLGGPLDDFKKTREGFLKRQVKGWKNRWEKGKT
ncbi:MAG: hypothetical protein CM1200mP10_21540 [Candidatus Neomarinimicrobiota bacterium]|nr:MAG: hypothetical protein CM1200mP10_21540 [Candidatus Neomarinimicrobiota bacterium]